MKLNEFFGNIKHNVEDREKPDSLSPSSEESQELADKVFWCILDDNELFKKRFMPLAKKLKKIYDSKSKEDDTHDWKLWIPMVNEGCLKYYKEHSIKGDPRDTFNKEFRKDLAKRLADHYHDDIMKGEYKLGI